MRWLFVALLAASCAPEPPPEPGKPTLTIAGSRALTDTLVPALTETHASTFGTIDFIVEPGGSSDGVKALLRGETDIAATSRGHRPAEQEQARANRYSLEAEGARHIVAVDMVAVAVHPKNPLQTMTYDQVIDIFCTGKLKDWEQLGLVPGEIQAYTLDPMSGTRAQFEDFFCGPKGIHTRIPQKTRTEVAQELKDNPLAVAFTSYSAQAGKLLALRATPSASPVSPSQANVIRGAYPLAHDLYLYTPGPATGLALDFIDWVATPAGQEVVDEARFVPLFLRPQSFDEPRPLRETVHFELGSSNPNQHSLARMSLLVEELQDRAGQYSHVVLEGYTDRTEDDAEALSQARAEAVSEALKKEIPGLFCEIIPRGPSNPIAPNETPYGRERNRRVQIYLEPVADKTIQAGTIEAGGVDG